MPRQGSIEELLGDRFGEFKVIKSFDHNTEKHPHGEYFSVVTWNISNGFNINRVIEALLGNPNLRKSDVFILQEVDRFSRGSRGEDLAARLSAETACRGVYVTEFFKTLEGKRAEEGNLILTKHPIANFSSLMLPSGYDWSSDPFEPGRLGDRHAIGISINVGEKIIRVYGTHLELVTDQHHRALQLRAIIDDAAGFVDTPTIVGGDFNVYLKSERAITLLKSAGFDLEPYEKNTRATLNDGRISRFPFTPDFIAARNLRLSSYHVVHVPGHPSDHNPVKAVYALPSHL